MTSPLLLCQGRLWKLSCDAGVGLTRSWDDARSAGMCNRGSRAWQGLGLLPPQLLGGGMGLPKLVLRGHESLPGSSHAARVAVGSSRSCSLL